MENPICSSGDYNISTIPSQENQSHTQEEMVDQAQDLLKKLGEEILPEEKRVNLKRRKERTARYIKGLLKNREKILSAPIQFNQKSKNDKGKRAYAFDRTETGTYGFTDHIIGTGHLKSAKIAIELASGKWFVRATAPREYNKKLYKRYMFLLEYEVEMQNHFKGENEFVQILHSYEFISKSGYAKRAILMEYCDGGDLNTYLDQNDQDPKNRSEKEKADLTAIFHDVLLGLVKMEEKKIIHRDLKPGNIFLYKNNQGDLHGKIGDFGFAEFEDEASAVIVGTLIYLSPEYILNRRDWAQKTKTDLWTLGLIIYEMLNDSYLYDDLLIAKSGCIIEKVIDIIQLLGGIPQETVRDQCNKKAFSDPFEQNMQGIMNRLLVLNQDERPDAKTIYQLYCEKFNLPSKLT